MEIAEFRIGNLIKYKNVVFHITNLSLDIDDEYEPIIGFCSIGKYTNEFQEVGNNISIHIEPIPLTEEWLLNLGFEKDDVKGFYTIDTWFKVSLHGDVELQSGDMYEYHSVSAQSLYVHQLQNLYFALTQKELSLKDENTL